MTEYMPHTRLSEAVSAVRGSDGSAKFVAGGTAVVLLMQMRLIAPDTLVGLRTLRDVPGWREIRVADGHLEIGGGVTLSQVAESPEVQQHAPSLAHAAGVVGNIRIRNVATIGGNLAEADYASDPPAVLVALGAAARVSDGVESRELPVEDLLVDFYETALADEVITHVRVPVVPAGRSVYLKYTSRSAEDRPCVGVAAAGRFSDGMVESAQVVVGAVAGTPQNWPEVTSRLVGTRLDAAVAAAVADEYAERVDPIEDVRGSAWYRREMVRVHVRRALEAIVPAAGADHG
jgi:carbon-monoxide dehydrogenase medium subunit